ncbi:hypothetical protein LNKW23_44270 [Paralimibaculum aggregatum]|uniref:Uncharacterized protein n=1 Tax=Paralimibaculum aggregatum TaxID=3036245 RepID=A0ABQ6LT17_9RHOB|nr:hypothetical protein [Limibaculum sp. NKW23]GMG85211.1 hypothetical protein LNKW23_44270 [Limibaculum sp. NKW23]
MHPVFRIEGEARPRATVNGTDAGELRFDLMALAAGEIGDLGGLFFDLADGNGAGRIFRRRGSCPAPRMTRRPAARSARAR